MSDIGTDSIKIGMLHNSESIIAVYNTLQEFNIKNIVLDPVMVATSGDVLLESEALKALMGKLIPITRVITPNIPEAEILLGKKINSQESLPVFAKKLADKFDVSVLLKAGHLIGDTLIDVFYNGETGELIELESKRVHTKNTHGTGCTLSSALASFIALGYNLSEAVHLAKDYMSNAIIYGADFKIGEGHGPVNHFYKFIK